MEINPQSTTLYKSPITGHTLRVDLEWTPSNVDGSIIYYDLNCTTPNSSWSGTSNTGSLSFSHTKTGYEYYHIQFRFYPCTLFPYPQPHNIQGTYTIFYDGRFMKTAPFQIQGICGSGGGNAIYNTAFRPPLITNYTFDIVTENYCFGSEGDIFISGNANNCSNTIEIDTSINKTLKLEILDGKDFVSFYQNGVAKDTATVRYDNIDIWNLTLKDITIKQDSFYTGSAPFEVITKTDWAGEIKYDTIYINPQTPTQIYVSDEQPIKVYTGSSSIQVKTFSNYSSDSCWTEMPDSVKYRAAIIKGHNLGNLIDYSTGNGGDMLINLDHNNGQRVIGFETEGENLTEQDTVIVSISTSDPNINTVQAMLIIIPGDINVQIIPGIISQGDTARVVLKKRGQNGLEDFPADKLFNVEIIEGIEYGLILDSLSNDTLTSFSDIPQGFKIIAKDSTGIDSTKIRIKVTTEETIVLPTARITKEKQKEEIQNKTLSKDDKEGEIIAAWIGDPGAPVLIEGFGDVVVKQDECSPLCTGEPPFTNILTTRLYNIYFDPCENRDKNPTTLELGGFTPVNGKDKWRNPSYFHPCFDDVEQVWRFSMNDIQLFVAVDFCQNNLNKYQVIKNISEVDSNEVCDAVKDFKDHEFYPPRVRNGGYMIMELLEKHEEIHERVYFEYMTENKQDFDRILSEFKPTCDQFPNEILAYAVALEKLDPLVNSYFTTNYEKWQDDMGWTEPIDKLKRKQDEDKTQNHPEVQAIWINYIKSLVVLYPSKYKKCK